MNWRCLIFLPILAWCLGSKASAPLSLPLLPAKIQSSCPYERALFFYLLAYAYREESPKEARRLATTAQFYSKDCGHEGQQLTERIHRILNQNLSQ